MEIPRVPLAGADIVKAIELECARIWNGREPGSGPSLLQDIKTVRLSGRGAELLISPYRRMVTFEGEVPTEGRAFYHGDYGTFEILKDRFLSNDEVVLEGAKDG